MAENEIIDMGHPSRWARTRRVLKDADCPNAGVAEAMREDMEGTLRALARVLRKGPSLSALLRLALGSSANVQAVISQFQEKTLATLVNEARNRCASNDPDVVATTAARILIERLIDQAECRAARHAHFRDLLARDELHSSAKQVFGGYEADLRRILADALRDGAPSFKRRARPTRSLTPQQLVGMSLLKKPTSGQESTLVK